jgi:SAM-dependent methyltransferase
VSLPEDIAGYYGANVEDERLLHGAGALEFERTKELVDRFLGDHRTIADVGGGTGRYANWLAEKGHRVVLVEPLNLHVDLARARAGDPPRFETRLADARALPFADDSFDDVLLLGPLYHLGVESDRAQAMAEAIRVCRGGGRIFAAAISRYAPLLDTIRRGTIADGRIFANVQEETTTGRRVPAERRTSPFPDAYFHLPEELEAELVGAGLRVDGIFGVEGPGWLAGESGWAWDDPAARERILWAARRAEADPHLVAVSAHLLAVAEKPVR